VWPILNSRGCRIYFRALRSLVPEITPSTYFVGFDKNQDSPI
jgi:hypothetical protein